MHFVCENTFCRVFIGSFSCSNMNLSLRICLWTGWSNKLLAFNHSWPYNAIATKMLFSHLRVYWFLLNDMRNYFPTSFPCFLRQRLRLPRLFLMMVQDHFHQLRHKLHLIRKLRLPGGRTHMCQVSPLRRLCLHLHLPPRTLHLRLLLFGLISGLPISNNKPLDLSSEFGGCFGRTHMDLPAWIL